jgi:hypothetical protein
VTYLPPRVDAFGSHRSCRAREAAERSGGTVPFTGDAGAGQSAGLLLGIALLLENERSLFAPVFAMVDGIAALVMANHERPRLRVDALEKRLAQREWRERAEVRWDR